MQKLCLLPLFSLLLVGCTDLFVDSHQFHRGARWVLPADMVVLESELVRFSMGTNDTLVAAESRPLTKVLLSYALGIKRTEVTRKEFQTVTGRAPWLAFGGDSVADNVPAVGVSWYDAIAYCNIRSRLEGLDTVYVYGKVERNAAGEITAMPGIVVRWEIDGYRLPTEAEWVFAARAGTSGDFPWPGDFENGKEYAWTEDSLRAVGLLKPNDFGLYDMGGNALEWTQDWLSGYPGKVVTDPLGAARPNSQNEKVVKGGSFSHDERFFRLDSRRDWYAATPATKTPYLGFRVVRAPMPPGSGKWSDTFRGSVSLSVSRVTRQQALSFFKSGQAKLVYTDVDGSALALLDMAKASPQVQLFFDSGPIFHPVLSPDGNWIAYATRSEGQGGNSHIYIRPANAAITQRIRLSDSLAFIPRWWVKPGSQDTFLVYASSAKANRDSSEWAMQRTMRQQIRAGSPMGKPENWDVPGAFHSGISLDGDVFVSGYTDLRVHTKSQNTTQTWFQSPANGKPADASTQVCNVSVSPEEDPRLLFIDFGSQQPSIHNQNKPYGVHELLFIADAKNGSVLSTIQAPPGQAGFDYPEWSNRPGAAVAVAFDAAGSRHAVQGIDLESGTFLELVSGSELAYPSLWLQDLPQVGSIDAMRAFQYGVPEGTSVTKSFAGKMQAFWEQRQTIDWVVLGSSRPLSGLDPEVWSQGYMYNFSLFASGPQYARRMIEEYLEYHLDLRGLVIGVDVDRLCLDTLPLQQDIYFSEGYLYDKENSFWKNGLPQGAETVWQSIPRMGLPEINERGYYTGRADGWAKKPSFDIYPCWSDNSDMHWNAIKDLEWIADWSNQKKIPVVFAIFPMNPGYNRQTYFGRYGPQSWEVADSIVNRLQDLENNRPYTMFLDLHKEGKHGMDSIWFSNEDHLSYLGATVVAQTIMDSLSGRSGN